jgi:hypothetical protein
LNGETKGEKPLRVEQQPPRRGQGEEKMGKLSKLEQEALEKVKTLLSKYVDPDRLDCPDGKKNEEKDYFPIFLDNTKLCTIVHESGKLKHIEFRFYEDIPSNDISFLKDKLLYALLSIAAKNDIPLP